MSLNSMTTMLKLSFYGEITFDYIRFGKDSNFVTE